MGMRDVAGDYMLKAGFVGLVLFMYVFGVIIGYDSESNSRGG